MSFGGINTATSHTCTDCSTEIRESNPGGGLPWQLSEWVVPACLGFGWLYDLPGGPPNSLEQAHRNRCGF